jgi:hypothetical protein
MHDDEDRRRKVRGQRADDLLQRLDAPQRGADRDDVAAGQARSSIEGE